MPEPRNFRGTQDFFGAQAKIRNYIIQTARSVFEQYGFEPLETPAIELLEVLQGKEGTQRLIKLDFKHAAALRFDHTVPLARFVAMNWEKVVQPYRRYAIGPVFRNETQQAGRLRQFTQIDFDTIGSDSLLVDAEIPAINYQVLTELGFRSFTTRINDRRLLDAIINAIGINNPESQQAIFRAWDKLGRVDPKEIREELVQKGLDSSEISSYERATDFLGSLRDKANDNILDSLSARFATPEVTQAVDTLDTLISMITTLGVPDNSFVVDPLMARGLDYYTGPIFETTINSTDVGSITGGGRFNRLIANLGGPQTPASGSSFGLERIMAVMEKMEIQPAISLNADVFLPVFDTADVRLTMATFSTAQELRHLGYKVEVYSGDNQKLAKQFKTADRKGIPLTVIIGPEELDQGIVTLKDMRSGQQLSIPTASLASTIKWRLTT